MSDDCIVGVRSISVAEQAEKGGIVDFTWYGAVADGVTDNADAWDAMMTALGPEQHPENPAPGENRGAHIRIPPGTYYFSRTPVVHRYCVVDGTCPGAEPRVKFLIAAGQHGLQIGPSGGLGAQVRGIYCAAAGKTTEAHGIVVLTQCQLYDCKVDGFKGHGIKMRGNEGEGSNCNNSFIGGHTVIGNCDGDGLNMSGGDCNNCVIVGLSVEGTGGWGIKVTSLLNNTFIGCHVADPAQVDTSAGPYWASSTGVALFLGCYAESSLSESHLEQPAMWIGGDHGTNQATGRRFTLDTNAFWMLSALEVAPFIVRNDRSGGSLPEGAKRIDTYIGSSGIGREALGYFCRDEDVEPYLWTYDLANRLWAFLFSRTEASAGAVHTAFGHAKGTNQWFFPRGVGMGGPGLGYGDFRQMHYGTHAPWDGTWYQGDIVWNAEPVTGAPLGWRCLAGGSPGTWEAFGGS